MAFWKEEAENIIMLENGVWAKIAKLVVKLIQSFNLREQADISEASPQLD